MRDQALAFAAMRKADETLSGLPEWLWDGESLPVPIETIADSHFGLLVRDVSDIAGKLTVGRHGWDHLSGALIVDRREIWVDAEEARDWPRRRRFTIAHELGHWVLHRDGGSAVHCRSTSVHAPDPGPVPAVLAVTHDAVEDEANFFGGALLMPPRLLRRHHARLGGDREALCDLFDISPSAYGTRYAVHMRAQVHLDFAEFDDRPGAD